MQLTNWNSNKICECVLSSLNYYFYISITVDIQYYTSFRCIKQWSDIYVTSKMTPSYVCCAPDTVLPFYIITDYMLSAVL